MERLVFDRFALNLAAKTLKNGGVIIFPTETVYGVGGLAASEAAVKRMYEIKKRPAGKPFQILISDLSQLNELTDEVSEKAKELIAKHWPGPLTLIFKKKGGRSTIGIRMPDHPLLQQLIRLTGPLASSSANLSGEPDPTSADEVKIEADLLLDGDKCKFGDPSTVIDVSVDPPKVLRKGPAAAGPG